MVVKKHGVVQNDRQLDTLELASYLQLMKDDPLYLPSHEIVKKCEEVVSWLACSHDDDENTWNKLLLVQQFLEHVVNSVSVDIRHEVITSVVDKLNQYTSDKNSEIEASASVVLIVIGQDLEAARKAARWLVEETEDAAGLRVSFSRLTTWLYTWDATPYLGTWIMALIVALQENEHFDILIDVSLEHLSHLFRILNEPSTLHQSSADVVLHVLASLRESKQAIKIISPYIDGVLESLASGSSQFSRQLLQNIVDILTAMMNILLANKEDVKNHQLARCLREHMASRSCIYLKGEPWRPNNTCITRSMAVRPEGSKVGLFNLGNTCYMNSMIQALLLTRQFSTHVMMRMLAMPYWAKLANLFAKMTYSMNKKVNPVEFVNLVRPPYFTMNKQHDCSEFLGYLFQLLQTYENHSNRRFDYANPPAPSTSSNFECVETAVAESNGSGPSTFKRSLTECESVPPKKRLRNSQAIRRNSIIDSIFGGVLLTRVECIECRSSSLSRDVFRDLQLAFPDKPENSPYSVQTLLDFYCSKEILNGDNQYHCTECGSLRDAEKSVLIETTPRYLILVLKNFRFDPKLLSQTKLIHKITYTQIITLPTVCSQAAHSKYSLYAAVIHCGNSLDSGHYYTVAKDADGWYEYDDERVTAVDEHQKNKHSHCCTPYVLFYKRTDIEETGAPAFKDLPAKLKKSVMSYEKHCLEKLRTNARFARP